VSIGVTMAGLPDMSNTRWCSDAPVMSRVAVVNAGIDGELVRDMMLEAVEYRHG
jgi:hypothetical protein